MVSQTSLDAFCKMQEDGRLSANERIVLDVFELYAEGRTNFEVAQILNWSINRVTGRTNALVKKGKLFAARKKVNIYSGCVNTVWVASKHRALYDDLGFSEELSRDGSSPNSLPPFSEPSLDSHLCTQGGSVSACSPLSEPPFYSTEDGMASREVNQLPPTTSNPSSEYNKRFER